MVTCGLTGRFLLDGNSVYATPFLAPGNSSLKELLLVVVKERTLVLAMGVALRAVRRAKDAIIVWVVGRSLLRVRVLGRGLWCRIERVMEKKNRKRKKKD